MGLSAAVALCCWAQSHLAKIDGQRGVSAARLSPRALQALSLGHPQTMADLLYLQGVALWGQRNQEPGNYADLGPLLKRALALDPYFEAAYLLGGTALTVNGMDAAQGVALLKEGATRLPQSWRLLFLYGFSAYDLQHDAPTAAKALAAAALLPGSPPFLPLLAAHLSTEAHDPQVAIMLLQTLLDQATDAEQAEHYRQRIAALRAAPIEQTQERHADIAEDTPSP